jgi:putative IMPACT (imprinted ancient) family translation regulator
MCIVYVYKYGNTAKINEDKEPKGTAGTPIFNVIEKSNINNILIIVVRYFGGIKLGAGGLFRAYSKSASEIIKKLDN